MSAEEIGALEHDYRYGETALVRQRSQIVLLAYQVETQAEIARIVRRSAQTVWRTLHRYRAGGRAALRRRPWSTPHRGQVTLTWQKTLVEGMEAGPRACGVARPAWTAPLLAAYLARETGIAVGERTVRRYLERSGYVCRRGTWTVRHKAEERAGYVPKWQGSRHF